MFPNLLHIVVSLFSVTLCSFHISLSTADDHQYVTNLSDQTTIYSSVWCNVCSDNLKCCEFQNLYFFPLEKTFSFVISDQSKLYGVTDPEELYSLPVSSVMNHTELFLPLTVMTVDDVRLKEVSLLFNTPIFLIYRFKPDNLMHVLHDDLLPLFARFESLCHEDINDCIDKIHLSYIDPLAGNTQASVNQGWYDLLTNHPIINLHELTKPVILAKSFSGLLGVTVGYQYGFNKPHGPVELSSESVPVFQRFSTFVKSRLNITPRNSVKTKHSLYIQRKESRRILNEEELFSYVQKAYQETELESTINTLNLRETTDTKQIISIVSEADLIFGMHGAATYMAAIFIKPQSSIIELYPFGIQPKFVSPIQSLSALPNCWFSYYTWVNPSEQASVVPSGDAPVLQGGLNHLSFEEQRTIKTILPVPAVQCCHNPLYLFRMFQDTEVGPQFQDLVTHAIKASYMKPVVNWIQNYVLPGSVLNLKCQLELIANTETTKMSWQPPINFSSLSESEITYDIVAVSKSGAENHHHQSDVIYVTSNFMSKVWVRACIYNDCGKDSFVECVKANEVKTIAKTTQNIKVLTKDCEITCMSWDEDEKEIYMGLANQTVKIYDTELKSFTRSIEAKCGEGAIVGVVSTANSLLTASSSGHVGIWAGTKCDIVNTGGVLERMRQNPYDKGIFATGGKSNDLKLWDIASGQSTFKAKNVPHNALELEVPVWVSDMTFMPDSRNVVVCTRYGQVRVYNPSSQRRPVLNIDIPEKALTSIAATPKQGHIVVGTGTGHMYLVDLRKTGLLCGHYKGVTGSVREIACHKSEPYIASVSLDRHLRIHHCDSRKLLVKVYLQSKLNCLLLREDFNVKEPLVQVNNSEEQVVCHVSGDEGSDAEDMNAIFKSMETISEPVPVTKTRKSKIIITGLDKPKKKKARV